MLERMRRKGLWVALAAAYMLVLQSLVGSFTLASGAHAAGLDAFGNPLCITGESQPSQGGPGHHDVPGCCLAGCTIAAVPAPLVSGSLSLEAPLGRSEPVAATPVATRRVDPERAEAQPRAPPAKV